MVALTLPAPHFLQLTLAVFWLMAFASATHDIAADGFYMLALPPHAAGGLRRRAQHVLPAGDDRRPGRAGVPGRASCRSAPANVVLAWAGVLVVLAAFFALLALWHPGCCRRPRPAIGAGRSGQGRSGPTSPRSSCAFFRKPGIGRILAFLLLYRFAEAQLLKLVTPFMLDPPTAGGLGLRTQDVGIAYGTVGVSALTLGGLLGGWVISRAGLEALLWPLMFCMHLPNLVFVALALWQPTEPLAGQRGDRARAVRLRLRLHRLPGVHADGRGGPDGSSVHKTAHYALCTGFMALGMMLPGMWAGWLQDRLGYLEFFIWVCVATLPSFVAAALVRIDPAYGRKIA